jgi:transcriptional regulator with XRE-family HTH domain
MNAELLTTAQVAERFGVSKTMVSKIKLGLQWRDNTNPWLGLFR